MHKELRFEEHNSSALIRSELDKLGISYEFPFAKTGLIAIIGSGSSRVITLWCLQVLFLLFFFLIDGKQVNAVNKTETTLTILTWAYFVITLYTTCNLINPKLIVPQSENYSPFYQKLCQFFDFFLTQSN